jgi:hypothetical protein
MISHGRGQVISHGRGQVISHGRGQVISHGRGQVISHGRGQEKIIVTATNITYPWSSVIQIFCKG